MDAFSRAKLAPIYRPRFINRKTTIISIIVTLILLILLTGLPAMEMTLRRSLSDSALYNKRPLSSTYSSSGPRPSPTLTRSLAIPQHQFRSLSLDQKCTTDYKFDHLQLTLMWAPGTCSTSPDQCKRGDASRFTIHGLWPQGKVYDGPENCCFQNNFVVEYLKPLMPALNQYWYSYFNDENVGFWSHEWRKHGTCAKNVEALKGEIKYFGTTINLVKNLPILKTLGEAGITPSDNEVFDSSILVKALRKIHKGKAVEIACEYEHDQPTPLIIGLNFCYDNDLNPIDCPKKKIRCTRQLKLPATIARFPRSFKFDGRNNNCLQRMRSKLTYRSFFS